MGKAIKMFFHLNASAFENIFYLIIVCAIVFIFYLKYYIEKETNEC